MVETKLLATLVATVRQEGIEQPVRVLVTVRTEGPHRQAGGQAARRFCRDHGAGP